MDVTVVERERREGRREGGDKRGRKIITVHSRSKKLQRRRRRMKRGDHYDDVPYSLWKRER